MPNHSSTLADRSVAVIMPAAGSGSRFGQARNKLFATIAGEALWVHSARRLRSHRAVGRIILPVADRDRSVFQNDFCKTIEHLGIEVVLGGKERYESVQLGIQSLGEDSSARWIAVHDAARPLVRHEDLERVFQAAAQNDAAILVTPVTGTLRRELPRRELAKDRERGRTETVDRRHLFLALTPQVFSVGLLKLAYSKHNGRPATDDAELVERLGHSIKLVIGASDNLKITYPHDLRIAEAILESQSTDPV